MASKVVVYVSSVSSNKEMKYQQSKIETILSGKKIEFELVDISSDKELLAKMREIAKDDTALPPQICRGDVYLGDYQAFDNAVEDKEVETFLKC